MFYNTYFRNYIVEKIGLEISQNLYTQATVKYRFWGRGCKKSNITILDVSLFEILRV